MSKEASKDVEMKETKPAADEVKKEEPYDPFFGNI